MVWDGGSRILRPHLSPPSFFPVQFVPFLKGLKQEQMEQILDRFDAREEITEGKKVFNQGDFVSVDSKGVDFNGRLLLVWS